MSEINTYGRAPEDRERSNLKTKRLNDERVCKKRLQVKKRMADLEYNRELEAIERGDL